MVALPEFLYGRRATRHLVRHCIHSIDARAARRDLLQNLGRVADPRAVPRLFARGTELRNPAFQRNGQQQYVQDVVDHSYLPVLLLRVTARSFNPDPGQA